MSGISKKESIYIDNSLEIVGQGFGTGPATKVFVDETRFILKILLENRNNNKFNSTSNSDELEFNMKNEIEKLVMNCRTINNLDNLQ